MIFKNIIIHKTISVFNIPNGIIEALSFVIKKIMLYVKTTIL